tara:strand:- start:12 stop:281 length:270 start_codon:yes stop_codon:yes gene_type:complete
MPYITADKRLEISLELEALLSKVSESPEMAAGDLNYILTRVVHAYLNSSQRGYQGYNDAMGALEGCKLELYRRHIVPYENRKMVENGDV